MKTNPFYKNNKNRNMDPKEKENINEEELMSEAAQKEATENEESQTEDVQQDEAALTEEEKLAQELEEANKVIEEQKDKYLRLSAEFDNYADRLCLPWVMEARCGKSSRNRGYCGHLYLRRASVRYVYRDITLCQYRFVHIQDTSLVSLIGRSG